MRRHSTALSAAPRERKPGGFESGGPTRGLLAVLAFAAALVAMAFSAASALAVEHPFKEVFGSAAKPSFGNAAGMAVDPATGDLLVIDLNDRTLHRYKSDGTPHNFSALGSNVIDGAGGADKTPQEEILSTELGDPTEAEVAVAPPGSAGGTAGDIYVTDGFNGVIDVFAPSGAYLGQKSFAFPCGVSVDPKGNVFVGDFEAGVYKLIPSAPATFSQSGASPYAAEIPCQVAAGKGFVYVERFGGAVVKIGSEGAGEGTTKYQVTVGETNGPIAVDPSSGHLFVASALEPTKRRVKEYDVSGETKATLVSTIPLASDARGVAVDGSTGNVYVSRTSSSNVEVFETPGFGGPKNLRTLTVTKSPSSSTGNGNGSVSSKPKGIKCGATCDEAVASMYKDSSVELAAKPSTGSSFVKWVGGDCNGSTSPTCTVGMDKDETTQAVFGGTSKAFSPAEALTISKGESSGKGTVKGPGLGCEAECDSTVVLFQGPITEPKAKAGKVVLLKQTPAFGSEFIGWSGCETEPEGNCQVAMESAKEVTAEYKALPNKALTVNKSYAKGNGSVSSKPKGIKCGTTCTQAVAQMPQGAAVELVAKPSSGTFVKWEGGDCAGSTNPVCTVTMNTDETTTAVFSDPGKAFSGESEALLTLNKAGSGFGTVKAAGLGCELLCSSTSVLYQGPIVTPKAKPGKVVVLKASSAAGSKAVEWSGCDSETEAGECVVAMETGKIVTATFEELE